MIQKLAKAILHTASGNRKAYYKRLASLEEFSRDKTILEIGSGLPVKGKYAYSAQHLFPSCKKFIMTDVNPAFGHKVLDITTMNDKNKYDMILCLNVLEHVYDFDTAIHNLHTSMRKGGKLVVAVPFTFPLHDEPQDYWRFTEHALRKMFADFAQVEISPQRARRFPTGYFLIATK